MDGYVVTLKIGGLEWRWDFARKANAQEVFFTLHSKHKKRPHDVRLYSRFNNGELKLLDILRRNKQDPIRRAQLNATRQVGPAVEFGPRDSTPGRFGHRPLSTTLPGIAVPVDAAPDGEWIDYEIFDRKGYPAPWLWNLLTDDDHQKIVELLFNAEWESPYD